MESLCKTCVFAPNTTMATFSWNKMKSFEANRPFWSCLKPLFQNEAECKAIFYLPQTSWLILDIFYDFSKCKLRVLLLIFWLLWSTYHKIKMVHLARFIPHLCQGTIILARFQRFVLWLRVRKNCTPYLKENLLRKICWCFGKKNAILKDVNTVS